MLNHLEERQLQMKARQGKKKVEDDRPLCSMPGCKRVARRGKPFCSRCTVVGKQEELRDALPGVVIPAAVVKEVGVEKDVKFHHIPDGRFDCSQPNQANTPKSEHFSRKQVCQLVGIGPTTLVRWEKKGHTPQPMKSVSSGQLLYTQEIIEKIREFKSLAYLPPSTPRSVSPSSTPGKFHPQGKSKFSVGKKVEKTVAKNLNFGRTRLL